MVLMPYVSAVLEIQLPQELYNASTSATDDNAGEVNVPKQLQRRQQLLLHLKHRFRNLAEASGNTHFVLECTTDPDLRHAMIEWRQPSGDSRAAAVDFPWINGIGDVPDEQKGLVEQFCGMDRLRLALEGVAQALFAMEGFNQAVWRKPTSDGGDEPLIPGTAVKTEARLQSLHQWQECVSTRGKWVYNPTPRVLPWNFHFKPDYCEMKHAQAGYLVLGEADRIAEVWTAEHRAGSEGKEFLASIRWNGSVKVDDWHVKEMHKWEWRPDSQCGRWLRFDPKRFCASKEEGGWGRKRKSIVVIGDSLNEQFARSVVNNILVNEHKPPLREAFHTDVPVECMGWTRVTSICGTYRFNSSDCSGLTLSFFRTDFLSLSNHAEALSELPWSRILSVLGSADVIVINRGAHFKRDKPFLSGMRTALRFLRNMHPNKLIIWRSTPVGHKDCDSHDKPVPEMQTSGSLPHDWGWFPHQNAIARPQVEKVGGIFMDVDVMSLPRADGHLGYSWEKHKVDCLHYCTPGPMDTWVQLLYNILLSYDGQE